MSSNIRVLVVGCGNMGASHARAYHKIDGFEIAGVVSRGPESREAISRELGGLQKYDDFYKAMDQAKPDAVSVNTYPDTHSEYVIHALKSGCHVFVEKPLALTVKEAQAIADQAKKSNLKVVVGYILRHHPSWVKFIEIARELGKPLVMRMNLNQQSSGEMWHTHKQLMNSMSPIVDCGVHYVDVMCQMTRSRPVRVQAMGARLSDELVEGMYNYGQLQVVFEDGSVGWYEAGWGPMVSETAFFVKDVVGPKGCVSFAESKSDSDDIDSHTRTGGLLRHYAELNSKSEFTHKDKLIDTSGEPDHQGLCDREQEFFLKAIRDDIDLSDHVDDAVNSLKIVLAADESVKTGRTVTF